MAIMCIQDFARGSKSFLVQAIGFLDGRDEERKPCIVGVRVLVMREDGLCGEIVLPHRTGNAGWVPVERLAQLLRVHPSRITIW